ncbi:peptidoglycan-binding domain-containing protein [Streptomyces cyaneus]|uniref:peptidoglycan-binding domain-containing protein n=1 Tax=Streptomyces cyaneus TaxID=1904 RepID=UPI000FF8A888|nr:peptidoglycan-binding domain-containing protein [Streptomyces cyaneus]
MSEPNGPVCPECGTPLATDGTSACSCGRLASDAHRETRTAEAAAAEDFDPVRIRPFVELGDGSGEGGDPDDPPIISSTATPAVDRGLSDVPQLGGDERQPADAQTPAGTRRGRRTLVITGAGAALAVLLTGAFVSGLFTYDSPSRDGSLPDGVRAPLPDGSAPEDNSPGEQSNGTSSAAAPVSPTGSSSTPSTGGSDNPSTSPTPTGTPSGPGTTTSASPTPAPSAPQDAAPVLRLGDQGPEVTELQLRLRQIGHYGGNVDGDYDREVEGAVRTYQLTRVILGDESGVYGRETRKSLESETSEP